MSQEQVESILRALGPLLVGVLIAWGVDSVMAGLISTFVLAVLSAGWAWYRNRPVGLAKAVAKQEGVQVVVSPTASVALKSLAADPAAPSVVPAAPNGGL